MVTSTKSSTSCQVLFIIFALQKLRKEEFLGMVGIYYSESLGLLQGSLTTMVSLAVTA